MKKSSINMAQEKITISIVDLVHRGHACNTVPYGISIIASYALKSLTDKIKIELFKQTNDFIEYLEQSTPDIVCFSNYIWNNKLSYQFAKQIKKKSPRTIVIFGGPNFPLEEENQKQFLLSYPEIDFYVYREGELAFVDLLKALLRYNLNVKRLKSDRLNIQNCHYLSNGAYIQGESLTPLQDLNEIPSPYLAGLCDSFISKGLIPLLQTTRGCPFQCTYCQEGDKYYSLVREFSLERIKNELKYIAQRTTVPNLILIDSNFGMYEKDLEICRDIALVQEKYGWPKYIRGIRGKGDGVDKDAILEASAIVQGAHLSAAVQSTDEAVLKNVKRKKSSLDQISRLAKQGETVGATTFSEVILCLPGDTKEAHFKSIFDLIEADVDIVRSHQFIMLPGSQASTKKSRQQYDLITRFRVTPNTVKPYQLLGETFFAPEIDEICVANNTMPFQDYLECRLLNLSIEIFYNDDIFQELLKFLKLRTISISEFIRNVHQRIRTAQGPLSKVYDDFLRETQELWETRDALQAFLNQPGTMERYVAGELGNNEQLTYRTIAIFKYMPELHRVTFDIAKEMLSQNDHINEQDYDYLKELSSFSLLRKNDIFEVRQTTKQQFHYDFVALANLNFDDNPFDYHKPAGLKIVFAHTDEQQRLISKYVEMFGLSNYGLGNILSNASQASNLYRKVK